MSLLDHYNTVCSIAGISPSEELLKLISAQKAPSESTVPVTTLEAEVELYKAINTYYGQQSLPDSPSKQQRAKLIAQIINKIIQLIPQIPESASQIAQLLSQLGTQNYPRMKKLTPILSSQVSQQTITFLNQNTPLDLISLAKAPVELLFSHLKDHSLSQLTSTENLQKRLKTVHNASETALALHKLTNATFSPLTLGIFSLSETEFNEQIALISASFLPSEAQCARILEEIFTILEADSIPLLSEFKGILKRKNVKSALSSIQEPLLAICENFLDKIDEFSYKISENQSENLAENIVKLRSFRASAGQFYAAAQLLGENQALVAKFKQAADDLKQREGELLKASKVLIGQLAGTCKNNKLLLEFDEKKRLKVDFDVEKLVKLYVLLQNFNYLPQLAFPNDIVSVVETGLGVSPSVQKLRNVADYYNNLLVSVKSYQKPLLMNSAAQFEVELKKASQQTQFLIGSTQKDVSTVERVKTVANSIFTVKEAFSLKIKQVNEFHEINENILKQLISIPLSQKQIWKEKIHQMRLNLGQFIKIIPQNFQDTLLQYWNSALSSIMAVKYQQSLSSNLSQLRAMQPLILTSKIELFPSITEVKNYLYDQIQQISFTPLNSEFYLSENPKINQVFAKMAELSISKLPEAFQTIEKVVANLNLIVHFLQKECGIVQLANSNDTKLFAQKLTLEQSQRVFDAGNAEMTQNDPEIQIRSNFPFLIEKSNEKSIFTVEPSGGSISIDLATISRVMSQKSIAMQEIASGAAGFHLNLISSEIIEEIDAVFEKVNKGLNDAKSAEELSEITKFFAKVENLAQNEFKVKVQRIGEFRHIVEGKDEILRVIDSANLKYQNLVKSLQNVSGTLENKKNEMWDGFKTDLSSQIIVGKRANDMLENIIYDVISYYDGNLIVRQPPSAEGYNLIFNNLPSGKSSISSFAEKINICDQDLSGLSVKIGQIDDEIKVLYNKTYNNLLDQEQYSLVQELLEKQKLCNYLQQQIAVSEKLELALVNILKLDWSILRVKTSYQDEILQHFNEFQELQVDEAIKSLDLVKKFSKSQLLYATFINKLSQTSILAIKQLKSPSLAKSHWHEISDKTNIIQAIKHFQSVNSASLPDQIDGTSLLYILAVNLFPNAMQILSETISPEYKTFSSNIHQILVKAEAELSVRSAVDEVTFYLQNEAKLMFKMLELSSLSVQETGSSFKCIPLHSSWKAILTQITEKKAILTSVLTNPFSKFIKEQIDLNNQQMEDVTKLAYVLISLQRQLTILEPVMGRRVLPDQHDKFYKAMKFITFILINAVSGEKRGILNDENAQVEISCLAFLQVQVDNQHALQHGKSIIQQIEYAQSLLNECQSALRIYLENKRLIFPRFYFLADQDVLEILANANQKPQTVQNHIKKLFSGVQKLIFTNNTITGIESSETEKLSLKQSILIQNGPEIWLKRLDLSIKQTLKAELMQNLKLTWTVQDVNKLQENDSFEVNSSFQEVKTSKTPNFLSFAQLSEAVKSNLDFKNTSSEILSVVFGVIFTAQVDFAMQKADTQQSLLEKVKQKLNQYLTIFTTKLFTTEISTATFGTENYVLNLKLKALATDATHYLTVISNLISSKNATWEWNKEMKYRIHEKSLDLYIVALDTNLPYTFEYLGIQQRLIHTPLTDRCYSTLITALSVSLSSNPQGPAGTGKTETVKAFSCKLARPCIVFNCDSAIDRENLSRILIGIVLSGSVGCFDEVNRLSPSVLSAVSTDIENIQTAILNKSLGKNDGVLTLADISVPITSVSAFSAVFVTMNPASREYRGRSELPFSLIKLLRGCFMGKADTNLIMETILSTSGFKFARKWAEKVDLTYQLASRRIPKEVHLDWGLRSLQAVLRQSAMSRAAQFRAITTEISDAEIEKLETQVILKSLSDATYSRIEGKSTAIFTEILADIFGLQKQNSDRKFGAASASEAKFVEFIKTDSERLGTLVLQLYRALTSKIGVLLLGKTASGKSEIFSLLKQAVSAASGGQISMQIYQIAPKSMSRQDLLGYVSKEEWNDGALSRAARQAVSSLQEGKIWPVLLFDGDIDPAWIEALNSSLDDNRLLSLSSGERIRFPDCVDPIAAMESGNANIPMPVSFLFETDSLDAASPATVSRLAVILVSSEKRVNEVFSILKLGVENSIQNEILASHIDLLGEKFIYCLFSELGEISADKYQQLAEMSNLDLEGSKIAPKYCETDQLYNKQQVYGINLIQLYFQNGNSVIVSGAENSGKFFVLQAAAAFRDQFKVVTLSCSQLTSREDILRILLSECVQNQTIDGNAQLKPKCNKKLLIIIRNADVVKTDEYGHSELFTLLWSVFAHEKIFLKGVQIFIKNVVFGLTVTNLSAVPSRLLRRVGLLQLRDMKLTCKNQKIFDEFSSQNCLKSILATQISHHESLQTQLSHADSSANSTICLPNYLKTCIPTFSTFKLFESAPQDQIQSFLTIFITGKQPFAEIKTAANRDIQSICGQQKGFLTVSRMTKTAQNIQKLLLQDEPTVQVNEIELVTQKVRLNLLNDVLAVAVSFYPYLVHFKHFISHLEGEQLTAFLNNLQAVEIQLFTCKNIVLLSQADNYSIETLTVSALTLNLKIIVLGTEKLNFKSIGELVARNFKLLLIFDEDTLSFDPAYLKLISAISAQETHFLASIFTISEIRNLLGVFAENCDISEVDEETAIQTYLNHIINNIQITIFLSPERTFSNEIFSFSPEIRRNFGVCAFSTVTITDMAPILTVQNAANKLENIIFNISKSFTTQLKASNFVKSNTLYNVFKQHWQTSLNKRKTSLSSGLTQLESAQIEVNKLSKLAETSMKSVEKAQNQANQALEEITKKMEITQQNVEAAEKMKVELSFKQKDVGQQKIDAEKQLGAVLPILEEATKAVQSIPNDALNEVKSFKQPPQAVSTVLEAVLTFMGNSDISWNGMRAFLSQNGILRQIASFDVKKVPVNQLKKVMAIVKQKPEAFQQEKIQKVSKAAAPLAKWVSASLSYSEVYVKIEPLMKAAEAAASSLTELIKEVQITADRVIKLEAETDELRANFNEKTVELMKWKTEFESISKKKQAGENLLENLKNEKIRWSENSISISNQLAQMDKCAIVNAVMFTVAGNQTDDVRQHLAKDYRKLIFDLQISQNFIDKSVQNGLFYSNQSLENVRILQQICENKQLNVVVLSFVTEATGVMNYLKNSFKGCQSVSAGDENLLNLLQIAARFGQKIIITDCDSGRIPAVLVPFIRYGIQAYQGVENQISDDFLIPNSTILTLQGQKFTEISPEFSVFIVSSVGVFVEENLLNKVVEMSFAPTQQSRSELYVKMILNEWSPETVNKIKELDQLQADMRGQLEVIEEELLQALENSKKAANILEDENLMAVLEKAKASTELIMKSQKESEVSQKQLQILHEKAEKIANFVTKSVQALEQIQTLNDLYIIDDSAVIPLLKQVLIQLNPKSSDFSVQLLDKTIKEYFIQIYTRLQQMVFQQDKTGALAILVQYCYPDLLNTKIYQFLSGTLPSLAKPQEFTWAGNFSEQISHMLQIFTPAQQKALKLDQTSIWGSLINKSQHCKHYNDIIPQNIQLSEFEKLSFLISVRPDLLNSNLQYATDQLANNSTLPIQSNPIIQAVELSTSITQPILVFSSSGSDPTSSFSADIISLAPGREELADAQFDALLTQQIPPKLIIFKGAHLCQNWLKNLPAKLNSVKNCQNTRVILLLEPKTQFPKNLLRTGWRICLSQTTSPKQAMLGCAEQILAGKSPIHRFVNYMISVFSVVLEGRKSYQPRGVSADPGWSSADSSCLVQILAKLPENEIFAKVKGYIQDCIYGVQTRESADSVLVVQLSEIAFSAEMENFIVKFAQNPPKCTKTVAETFQLVSECSKLVKLADCFPFLKFLIPPFQVLQDGQKEPFLEYLNNNFPGQLQGEILGLKSNALVVKGENDSLVVRSILARAKNEVQEGSNGVFEAVLVVKGIFEAEIEHKIAQNLNSILNFQSINSLSEELISQGKILQKVVETIKADITECEVAAQNFNFSTLKSTQIAQLLTNNILPESWCNFVQSPPCSIAPPEAPELVTLNSGTPGNYLKFILKCSEAILSSLELVKLKDIVIIQIQFMPRPNGIIEAVRRYEGQVAGIELDKIELVASCNKMSGPRVVLEKGSVKLIGGGLGAGIDFNVSESKMGQIWLGNGKAEGRKVPFYVDKARTMRVAVVENLSVEANENSQVFIDVYGVYAVLDGR